jgi:predicted nuclease of predicted toxin-antitoxin system
MLRFLADENFDGRITAGLLQREPSLDLVRVQDVGLSGIDDPAILAWAAAEERLLLTHDRKTIPGFAV